MCKIVVNVHTFEREHLCWKYSYGGPLKVVLSAGPKQNAENFVYIMLNIIWSPKKRIPSYRTSVMSKCIIQYKYYMKVKITLNTTCT